MYQKEILQKIYLSVPEEIVEVIASPKTFDVLSEIAAKNNLSVEQLEKLQSCVGYRLMGVFSKQTLLPKIKENLNLPDSLATTIGSSLEQEIISKVPNDLLTHQEKTASNIIKGGGEQDGQKNTLGNLPAIPPEDLPAIVSGEKVHDTVPQKKSFQAPPAPTTAPSAPVNLPTDGSVPAFTQEVSSKQYVVGEDSDTQRTTDPTSLELRGASNKQGEIASKPATPTHYAPGQDPYREPLE